LPFAKIPSALKRLTFQASKTDASVPDFDNSSLGFAGLCCLSAPLQSGSRKPRPSPAARDHEATASTIEASKVRSNLLAALVAHLVSLEGDVGHREARNRRPLASKEIRVALDPLIAIVLAHDRRRIVHFNVTEHPTAEWTSWQVVEAFGDGKAPRCMIRDRDAVYGLTFRERGKAHGIEEATAARPRAR
jgi:hypothetical protein